ncbi:hypothetical protein MMC07_009061 [Pseudocyphellaria aurata]|nr:hypothetical protein [Pseudocyphellaria aurata]
MTSLHSSLQPPSIPPEIWDAVASHLCHNIKCHDLAYQWTECRNISRQFRQAVEREFAAKHLPKTSVQFNLGKNHMSSRAFSYISESPDDEARSGILLSDDGSSRVQALFSFNRLSNDRKTAFFRCSCSDTRSQDIVFDCIDELFFDCIDELSPDALNDASLIVQIRYYVHDIYIADLKVHKSSKEISFDWQDLFSLFFAEEKAYGKIMQRWKKQDKIKESGTFKKQPLTENDDGDVGDFRDFEKAFVDMLNVFTVQEKTARRQARRTRIRRQSQDLKGEDIDFDEDFALIEKYSLRVVKKTAFAAGFESFSDDECDELPAEASESTNSNVDSEQAAGFESFSDDEGDELPAKESESTDSNVDSEEEQSPVEDQN